MPMSAVRRAWWGVIILFLVHGLVVSSWISRIPAIQIELDLSNGVLGLTLLSAAVGAVFTIPVIGYLVSRFGSRPVCIFSSSAFCLSVSLMGFAVNAFTLAFALFTYGACAAAMDVSMNAQGVEVEKRLGSPTMSRFHAMFSVGAMGGAAFGGWLATRGVTTITHFAGSSVLNLAAVFGVASLLIADTAYPQDNAHPHRLPLRKTPTVLLALSAIGFCILLAEGAMADWIAVYLRQDLRAGPGTAALGYAVFSGAMAAFRFLGDLITARLGPQLTVRSGCVIAGLGLLTALAAPSAALSLPGFAAAGVGLSVVIPLVFGSGGKVPGVSPGAGIATVTGIGYVGFIVGPPAIGFASQLSSLRVALVLVVLCCFVAAWLAGYMRLLALSPLRQTASMPPYDV